MANHDFSAPAAVADGFNRNGIVPLEHHVQQFQCGFFLPTIMFASLVRIDRTRAMFFEHPVVLQEQLRVPQPAVTPACGFTGLLGHNFLCTLAGSFAGSFFDERHHIFRDSHFAHPPVLRCQNPSI